MRDLLEYIVKSIVNNPDGVVVTEAPSQDFPGLTILSIEVAPGSDAGIVIGKRGRTINAIRDIITISAIRNDKRVKVILKDDREPRQESDNRSDDRSDESSAPVEETQQEDEPVLDTSTDQATEDILTDEV